MSRLAPIAWRTLARIFEIDGWKLSRTRGDHLVYTKSGFSRPVIIPKDHRVEVFIILNNIRTAKISRERYFELLQRV